MSIPIYIVEGFKASKIAPIGYFGMNDVIVRKTFWSGRRRYH